jgi:hypothetical protein
MGNILAFRPRKQNGAAAPKKHKASATVIIFPGVRYERMAGESAAKWSPVTWIGHLQRPLPTS